MGRSLLPSKLMMRATSYLRKPITTTTTTNPPVPTPSPSPPPRPFIHTSLVATIYALLLLHALHEYQLITLSTPPSPPATTPSESLRRARQATHPTLPDLIIFRRTRKTGSTSLTLAFLSVLPLYGYHLPPHKGHEVRTVVRNEFARPFPRRLAILHHNNVLRSDHPRRNAVIIDTVRDGFRQVTSYCRYMRRVKDCASREMEECLRSADAMGEMLYRWGGKSSEDTDTYIDLPVSGDHPLLTNRVLQTVFPNISVTIERPNSFHSSCAETATLRSVYDELYAGVLDKQVDELRKRMLRVAGYPFFVHGQTRVGVGDEEGEGVGRGGEGLSLVDMMDEAERREGVRLGLEIRKQKVTRQKTDELKRFLSGAYFWVRGRSSLRIGSDF